MRRSPESFTIVSFPSKASIASVAESELVLATVVGGSCEDCWDENKMEFGGVEVNEVVKKSMSHLYNNTLGSFGWSNRWRLAFIEH